MESLEGVVGIDGDSALQTVHLEGDHTRLPPGLHVGQMILRLDDVLELFPDEDAAQEPVKRRHHPTTGAAWQLTGPTQLVKGFGGEWSGDGCGPESLGQDTRGRVTHRDS